MIKFEQAVANINVRLIKVGLCFKIQKGVNYHAQLRLFNDEFLNGYQLHPADRLREIVVYEANRAGCPVQLNQRGTKFWPVTNQPK